MRLEEQVSTLKIFRYSLYKFIHTSAVGYMLYCMYKCYIHILYSVEEADVFLVCFRQARLSNHSKAAGQNHLVDFLAPYTALLTMIWRPSTIGWGVFHDALLPGGIYSTAHSCTCTIGSYVAKPIPSGVLN
jgi:hypothetical protein